MMAHTLPSSVVVALSSCTLTVCFLFLLPSLSSFCLLPSPVLCYSTTAVGLPVASLVTRLHFASLVGQLACPGASSHIQLQHHALDVLPFCAIILSWLWLSCCLQHYTASTKVESDSNALIFSHNPKCVSVADRFTKVLDQYNDGT